MIPIRLEAHNKLGQYEHKPALLPPDVPPTQPRNLLLLSSADDNWSRAVHRAASGMAGVRLETTSSVHEAMTCLVLGDPDYSHFLVAAECAGEQIGELAKLTAGEAHNRTALVMLGSGGCIPPRSAVVRRADSRAVARAIGAGEPPGRRSVAPLALDELHAALAGTRLHTRYQPIVQLANRRPVGLEVLARLDHPVYGTLSPDHFVPQMELAGLSRRLTEAVVARAFADHAAYLQPLGLWLALNFPLDVLMDEPALTWLEERRLASGIGADRIIVELTESRPVADLDESGLATLGRSIARLRGLGYGLAIDDVGPEMKNHQALFSLGFTSVKLDKGLVAQSAEDGPAREFLAETVALARKVGFLVVAEGVKDEATWERMRLAGADQAQGFMVARPLPAAAVPVWMQAWQARAS